MCVFIQFTRIAVAGVNVSLDCNHCGGILGARPAFLFAPLSTQAENLLRDIYIHFLLYFNCGHMFRPVGTQL